MGSRKEFDREFKLAVVGDLLAGKLPAQVSREHDVKIELARRWLREYNADPQHAFAGKGVPSTAEARLAEAEKTIGRLYMQVEFLKKASEALQARLAEAKNER